MALAVELVARETPAPPCGLITVCQDLPEISKRAPALRGFLLAVQGANAILYHPSNAEPDLPWLGDKITYICRYGSGFYGPVGLRLNIPDVHLPRFHQKMISRHNIQGDLLIISDAPLTLCDLRKAQPVELVAFDALQEQLS